MLFVCKNSLSLKKEKWEWLAGVNKWHANLRNVTMWSRITLMHINNTSE